MLWSIPLKNRPGVFLQNNASGPLRSWSEIFPENRRDHPHACPLNPGSALSRTRVPSAASGGKNKTPVEIPRKSDLPPRN